jgi:hypothetical protein
MLFLQREGELSEKKKLNRRFSFSSEAAAAAASASRASVRALQSRERGGLVELHRKL